MHQKKIWNKIAKPWRTFREKSLKEVSDFIRKQKGKILDIGCGSGRNFIKRKDLKFYGIDFSKEMLKFAEQYAKEKNIAVELKKARAIKIPYKNNFFDAGIFIATLNCIKGKNQRKKALKELYRVLKPNAKAFITVWSRNNQRIKNKPKEALIPWTVDNKKYYRYYYIYEKEELKKLLEEISFKIKSIKEEQNIVVVVEKD